MPMEAQTRLLRVLQQGEYTTVGGRTPIRTDGRIVAESTAIEDDMVVADLDLSLVPNSSGQRWMTGRRPELYSLLTERRGDERSPRATRFDLKE